MNHIAELLPEANIALDIEATSKKRLFEQIGQLFEEHAQIARSVATFPVEDLKQTEPPLRSVPGPAV